MGLTGIGGFLGDIGGAAITGAANAKQAQQNRDFQERMSNTAHQRQVADMRAAGINPMLSGMGGSGASQPGGAQASMPDMSGMGSRAVQSASSAQQRKLAKEQTGLLTAEARNKKAYQDIIANDPDLATAQMAKQMGLGDEATTALVAMQKARREGKSITTGKERFKENLKADWENIKAQTAKAKSAAQLAKKKYDEHPAQKAYRWTNQPFKELYKWGRKKMKEGK